MERREGNRKGKREIKEREGSVLGKGGVEGGGGGEVVGGRAAPPEELETLVK